jgi:hypothetical protein
VRTRRGQCDYLGVDALSLEHPLAIDDVPMACNGDIVITGVMQTWISFRVYRNPDNAVATAKRVEILGRIEMIVNVDQCSQLARR